MINTYPAVIAEMKDISAIQAKHQAEQKQHQEKRAELGKRLSPQVVAKNPDAVREYSLAQVEEQMSARAVASCEEVYRDLAAKAVPLLYDLERKLTAVFTANREIIEKGIWRRMAKFYSPECKGLIVARSNAATAESAFEQSRPSAVGDPSMCTLHPDIQPSAVLTAYQNLEKAIAVAEARGLELKREFGE